MPVLGKIATWMGTRWAFQRKCTHRDTIQIRHGVMTASPFDLFQVSPLADTT